MAVLQVAPVTACVSGGKVLGLYMMRIPCFLPSLQNVRDYIGCGVHVAAQ